MNNNLYSSILQYGQKFPTALYMDPQKIQENLETFSQEWKPYNPRKKVAREGLSVTSLDGGLSGIPDLDSVREYCIENQIRLTEMSFNKETPVAPIVKLLTVIEIVASLLETDTLQSALGDVDDSSTVTSSTNHSAA